MHDPNRAASSEDIALMTRCLLERMERDQDERRSWQEDSMSAYQTRGSGISGPISYEIKVRGLMISWLVARTIVELAIFVALILIWRTM